MKSRSQKLRANNQINKSKGHKMEIVENSRVFLFSLSVQSDSPPSGEGGTEVLASLTVF